LVCSSEPVMIFPSVLRHGIKIDRFDELFIKFHLPKKLKKLTIYQIF